RVDDDGRVRPRSGRLVTRFGGAGLRRGGGAAPAARRRRGSLRLGGEGRDTRSQGHEPGQGEGLVPHDLLLGPLARFAFVRSVMTTRTFCVRAAVSSCMLIASPLPVMVVPSLLIVTGSSVARAFCSLFQHKVAVRISRPSLDRITTFPVRVTS